MRNLIKVVKCLYQASCDGLFRTDSELIEHVRAVHVPDNEHAVIGTVANMKKFKASNGWLEKFKFRHNITNVAMVGEKGSCDYEAAEEYVRDLRRHLIECGYLPQQVMEMLINIDECGLQWKSLPKRTYALRGKPIKAKKLLKDRVTILVGAAMDGHKFKPLVIGKSLNPRCLKNVDRSTLPVHY